MVALSVVVTLWESVKESYIRHRKGGVHESGSTKGHMRSLPCPVIQKHTFKHTTGEYTGAHASRHTHPPPRGRVTTQAQFVRMEKRHIMYSSQHPPPPKGVWEILFVRRARSAEASLWWDQCEAFWETYLGQSTNLKLNLKLRVACKRMGTWAAPLTRASVAEALPGHPPW